MPDIIGYDPDGRPIFGGSVDVSAPGGDSVSGAPFRNRDVWPGGTSGGAGVGGTPAERSGGKLGGGGDSGGGSLPIFDWMKKGAGAGKGALEAANPYLSGASTVMGGIDMATAPGKAAAEEAKMREAQQRQQQQSAAWQSPEYMEWARSMWGG